MSTDWELLFQALQRSQFESTVLQTRKDMARWEPRVYRFYMELQHSRFPCISPLREVLRGSRVTNLLKNNCVPAQLKVSTLDEIEVRTLMRRAIEHPR